MLKKFKQENILYLFILLQPMIRIYRTFWGDNIKLFGLSFFEMINTFFIIGLWVYTFYKTRNKKMFYIILYFFALGGYCIIHFYNMTHFNQNIMERSMYGFVKECYNIFRVYGLPILFLFTLLFVKLRKEFVIRVVCDVAMLISVIVVFSNLTCTSLCTYIDEGHKRMIHGNIFSWFMTDGTEYMKLYTSSGWFDSGNEISGLLFMTFPVVIYQFLNKFNAINIFRFGMVMLSMIMIGTKTATIGSGLLFLAVTVAFLIIEVVRKNYRITIRGLILVLSVSVVWGLLFYFSPYFQGEFPRVKEKIEIEETESEIEEEEDTAKEPVYLSTRTDEESEKALEYIQNHYWNHYVKDQYIQLYPIEGDLDFWVNVMNRNPVLNQNYRNFKQELLNRILERNDQTLDKWVGIGTLQEIYCERDYASEYYMYGIVGCVLLLGPYVLALIINIILFMKNIRRCWNSEYLCYMFSLGVGLLLPYVTGHMFGVPMVMFQLVWLIILLRVARSCIEEKGVK